MPPWKVVQSDYLLKTPYINLRRDTCQLPNGTLIPDYHVVEEPDYGVVFALTATHEVVLVRQYKHGIGKMMLELPAGFFDTADEQADPITGCLREFQEETGYTLPGAALVGAHVRHPTRNNNRGYLVAGVGAYRAGQQQLDTAEDIDVILHDIETVLSLVRTGEIDAVGSVASIFLGLDYLRRTGALPEIK